MQNTTIAAIATAPGAGGIAVVRLSGPESYAVAARVFHPANPNKNVEEAKGYTALFGSFVEGDDAFDEGVALFFREPHSYTGEKLGKFLENIPVSEPKIPYVANVTAAYVTKAEDVKPLLTRQVSSSVRWQQSVETMLADGVDRFIEIGPGKTLAGFIRKINREATVINIEKFEDLEKLN